MARLYREQTKLPPQVKWFAVVLGVLALGFFLLHAWTRHELNWYLLFWLGLSVIFWFAFKRQENGQGPTSLEVDDHGLTYKHMWMVRRWAWSELSAPEMARGGINFDSYIRLRPARPIDWVGRLLLPGLASDGSEICIRPVYGVPLEEMLEELKACRGRANLLDEAPEGTAALPA